VGHQVSKLRIVTGKALATTHKRDAITTFHHMELLGTSKSILSCLKMEVCGAASTTVCALCPAVSSAFMLMVTNYHCSLRMDFLTFDVVNPLNMNLVLRCHTLS
jgi:hypothetical protein